MLTDKHRKIARKLSRQYDIDGMDREDIEQEAILVILQALRDGTPDEHIFNKVRTHLYNMTRREPAETLGRDAASVIDPKDDDGTNLVDESDAFDVALAKYGDSLTDRERVILRMTHHDGLNDDEIAERLGLSVHTVRNVRKAAVKKIRDETD